MVLSSPSLTAADESVGDRVEVVEGQWPAEGAEPAEGMLHAATAADAVAAGPEADQEAEDVA